MSTLGARVRIASGDSVLLWCAFVLVHVLLALLNLIGPGFPMADVTSVYRFWVAQALGADYWVGIDGPWVYPILAFVPMLLSQLLYPVARIVPGLEPLASGPLLFGITWLVLVIALNAVALGALTEWGRRSDRRGAAWWWLAFLVLLGPITLGRIDAVTVALALVGVTLVARHPRAAALVLTLAAWVKVWPGVIVVAMVVLLRERWRVAGVATAASLAVVGAALLFGSGGAVFSFVTEQAGRGLQVEAPVAAVWLWLALAGAPGAAVYYSDDILTWQVSGSGVDATSAVMTPLIVVVVAAVAVLAAVLLRRGATAAALLPATLLALVTGMIAFQKVGSPQFFAWLAVPVVLGIATHARGSAPSFRAPAVLVLVVAALTQLVYPYFYGYLLALHPAMLVVLTARNVLLLALFALAVVLMVRAAEFRPASRVGSPRATVARGDDPRQDAPRAPAGSPPQTDPLDRME